MENFGCERKNFGCEWKTFSCDSLSPSFCNLTDLGIGTLANSLSLGIFFWLLTILLIHFGLICFILSNYDELQSILVHFKSFCLTGTHLFGWFWFNLLHLGDYFGWVWSIFIHFDNSFWYIWLILIHLSTFCVTRFFLFWLVLIHLVHFVSLDSFYFGQFWFVFIYFGAFH